MRDDDAFLPASSVAKSDDICCRVAILHQCGNVECRTDDPISQCPGAIRHGHIDDQRPVPLL